MLTKEERQWITDNEKKLRGCVFAVSKRVSACMVADKARFRSTEYDTALFCHTLDQPPVFHLDIRQFFYSDLAHVAELYVRMAAVGQADEDAFTLWCASHAFPGNVFGPVPPLAKRATLYMNYPSDIAPCPTLVQGEAMAVVRAELHALAGVAPTEEDAFAEFFKSAWRHCVNDTRKTQRRAAYFANRITTNDSDMGIVVDNVCVIQTLEVVRWLMDWFGQQTLIDQERIDGVTYACMDRAYYGPFFMAMYGISQLNRSRLSAAYRTCGIGTLARYYVHYTKDLRLGVDHFAYSAWLFALMQSTMPECKLTMVRRDVVHRIASAIEGAEHMQLHGTLMEMHRHVVQHRVIDLKPFADMMHTLHCALLRADKTPRGFTVLIRSTLLAAVVDNIVHSNLPDTWRAGLIAESAALHPDNDDDVTYIELRTFGMQIVSTLWDQWMDLYCNRASGDMHPAWRETLRMVPRYGFRTSMHPTFSRVDLRGMDCFLLHPEHYHKEELILRLFEMCWCGACHESTKGVCGHIAHDIKTRDNVDLYDVKVDGKVRFAECSMFSAVDTTHFYLFRGVTDPSLCQYALTRLPLPVLPLVCY